MRAIFFFLEHSQFGVSQNLKKLEFLEQIYPFHSQVRGRNSPYCLSYSSYDVNSENLVLDQLIIP